MLFPFNFANKIILILMNIPESTVQYISEVSRKYNKDFQICSKGEPDCLLKIITPLVLLFNKKFTTNYITVLFGKMWVPATFEESANESLWLRTTIHETMHEKDRTKLGSLLFTFLYLFPQNLSLLAFLALGACGGHLAWLWWLLCLLFLAPMPAPGRAWLEVRAYRTNLLFAKTVWKYDDTQMATLAVWLAEKMAGPDYYFSWMFKSHLEKVFLNMEFMEEEEYKEIEEWVKAHHRS